MTPETRPIAQGSGAPKAGQPVRRDDQTPRPALSADFYASLRPEPGCEIDGVCNECGRCEH